jgi:hypothetical protein
MSPPAALWSGEVGALGAPDLGQEGARRLALTVPACRRLGTYGKGDSDVRQRRVWARLLGIERAVVEDVRIDEDDALVVSVRPKAGSWSDAGSESTVPWGFGPR